MGISHLSSWRRAPSAPIALAIVGHNRAGKSTAAQYLGARLSAKVVELGHCVRQAQAQDSTLANDTNEAYRQLLERNGPELLSEWFEEAGVGPLDTGIIVGIRDIAAYEAVNAHFPQLATLAVIAPLDVRARRQLRPGQTPETMRVSEQLHASWGVETIIAFASYRVENTSAVAHFHAELDLIASRL